MTREDISILIGIAGLILALRSYLKRKKIEKYIDENIDALEESCDQMISRATWAKNHIDELIPHASNIKNDKYRASAVKHVAHGRGDATSAQDLPAAIKRHLKALRNKPK